MRWWVLLVVSTPAWAQVLVWTDREGQDHYTDDAKTIPVGVKVRTTEGRQLFTIQGTGPATESPSAPARGVKEALPSSLPAGAPFETDGGVRRPSRTTWVHFEPDGGVRLSEAAPASLPWETPRPPERSGHGAPSVGGDRGRGAVPGASPPENLALRGARREEVLLGQLPEPGTFAAEDFVGARREAWVLETVATHNRIREKNWTPAPPLAWDEELARQAQLWANRCGTKHSRAFENLAWGGREPTPGADVTGWAEEARAWNPDTGTCSGVCGHYLMVVSPSARVVGCGWARCTGSGSPFPRSPTRYMSVCHYR